MSEGTETATAPEIAKGGDRVLVVDDNSEIAEVLAMMLSHLGYQTVIAVDGMDALRKAMEFRPNLIFLDIRMPKLDGFDACSVIRAQPWAPGVKLIAVTGLPEEQVRDRYKKAGFDAYVLKPIEFDALERAMVPFPGWTLQSPKAP